MTPKEKAKELFEKFENSMYDLEIDSEPGGGGWVDSHSRKAVAKQCALIAVDEIILNNKELLDSDLNNDFSLMDNNSYWNEVRKEIEKL